MNTIRENFILTCNTILYSDDLLEIKSAYKRLFHDYRNLLGDNSSQTGANTSCFLDVLNIMFTEDGKNKLNVYTQDAYTYLQQFITIICALNKKIVNDKAPNRLTNYDVTTVNHNKLIVNTLQGYLLYCIAMNYCDITDKNIINAIKSGFHKNR